MKLKKLRRLALFSSLLLGPMGVGNAANGELEEVIVTASKRAQNIQDVATSVATMSEKRLSNLFSGGADVLALSGTLPSLYIETSDGRLGPRYYIRGFGNVAFDVNASQPVSVVYDEIVLEQARTKSFPIFDVKGVEVLRGPQGTLFGRNTPAGVVKFDSNKPTEEFDAQFSAIYGRFNQRKIEGAVSGSLIPGTLTARASILYNAQDDWIDNVAVGFEEDDFLGGFAEVAGRFQLLWTPNDEFTAWVKFEAHNLYKGSPPIFRAGVISVDRGFNGVDFETVSHDSGSSSEIKQYAFTSNLTYDFAETTLTSVTGYRTVTDSPSLGDIDGGSLTGPTFPGNVPFLRDVLGFGDNWALDTGNKLASHKQFSQEFRLASNEFEGFRWMVGLYYFHDDYSFKFFNGTSFPAFGAPPLVTPRQQSLQSQNSTGVAVFSSFDYDLSDDLTLKAGLRYSKDEKDFEVNYLAAAPAGVRNQSFEVKPSDTAFTGDLSLMYAVNDEVNVYGKIAKGYRGPSVLARNSVPSIGESESIISYEVGFKSTLLDNRMRLNIAAYRFDVSDQQLSVIGGASNTISLVNADNTLGYGVELDSEFAATDNLLLTLGLSYNVTEINDSELAITTCGGACTVRDPVDPNNANRVLIDGNPLPNAPEWIGNVTARYSHALSLGELFFFTDWSYRSSLNAFLYDSPAFEADSRIEGGLRIGYIPNNANWEVAAFARNILNEEARVAPLDFFDFNGTSFTSTVNEPRMFGIEFKYYY